jgi:type I restriction enzyme R subunit
MKKYSDAIKSYEKFEEDFNELSDKINLIIADFGHIENEKAAVKEILTRNGVGEKVIDEALSVEFSADQRATLEETIDSYYINQLLQDIKNESNKNKFDEIIKGKPDIVKTVYKEIINGMEAKDPPPMYIEHHFRDAINKIIRETALILKVSEKYLQTSFNEYNKEKREVPYLETIIKDSSHTKESFEQAFPGEKFRRKIIVIEDYWKNVIEEKLLPLKKEIV